MKRCVAVIDLNRIGYQKAFSIQKEIFDGCYRNELLDTIIFQENDPTITIGRSGSRVNLLFDEKQQREKNIEVITVDRGGDVTFHGPGQCVISLIFHIKEYTNNIHDYLRKLEEVVILLLSEYDIVAQRIPNLSGVWVNHEKIASIGISVEHGITRHGIAINVNPDLSYFDSIIACGIKDVQMTSIEKTTERTISIEQVKNDFLTNFSKVFNVQYESTDYERKIKHEK